MQGLRAIIQEIAALRAEIEKLTKRVATVERKIKSLPVMVPGKKQR